MEITSPIVAAVGLDGVTADLVRAATDLARRIEVPIVPVHALPPRLRVRKLESRIEEARRAIVDHFAPAIDEGITVMEPVVAREEPSTLVLRTSASTGAQMIVAGGGEPETVRRWLVGSVAEYLVRAARIPVFIARGTMPGPDRPIVCPVDLSPQSHLGFTLAVRLARLFGAPLKVVTVIPPDRPLWFGGEELEHGTERVEQKAREELELLLAAPDTEGVDISISVLGGRPVPQILDAAADAHLVVMGSSGFDYLLPGTFGGTAEKVLRGAWSSVLAVRDADPDRDARERHLMHVAALRKQARALLDAGRNEEAVERARAALDEAPGHAGLYDLFGDTLAAVDREADAKTMHELATMIRESIG